MLRFYFNLSPNPTKVALYLEEAGLPYEAVPVDTRRGQQHDKAFLAVNPNGKVPAIVDGDVTVFDSSAILLYLAERDGRFLPPASKRGEFLSWLMLVASGIGPYSGQAVHFKHFAEEKSEYAHKRYQYEARRHFGLLETRLADREWLMGGEYTILDMAVWGWARMVPFILGDEAWGGMPHLKRLLDTISARPAAARALALKEKHAFKAEMDQEARAHMFKHVA